ncbi:hypothetical protein OUZ56_016365 [Daphnia magna]|uniref:Uncharacterized protein n=1 Tax=Daphnia magna TaxID=35525 RepID=A0ABR0AQK2_9CRUS|nr:hypothetical protein OUZ56_016365 [Daphnia magna]
MEIPDKKGPNKKGRRVDGVMDTTGLGWESLHLAFFSSGQVTGQLEMLSRGYDYDAGDRCSNSAKELQNLWYAHYSF